MARVTMVAVAVSGGIRRTMSARFGCERAHSMTRSRKNRPSSEPPSQEELRKALAEGDPHQVAALIRAGANIHYTGDHGNDALLDAVYGRDVARDPRLLELLTLLVNHGVNLFGVSSYNESAVRELSRVARFDAVALLLEAGADKSQLGWTPLIEAVALGSLADVAAVLKEGAALEEKDCWSRTAWLIAVRTGDIAKAKLLGEHGADTEARGGRGGFWSPPLFYAVNGRHPEMLRWLLQNGADVRQTDDRGATALIRAVEKGDIECVDILLAAGADIHAGSNSTALKEARSRDIILRLLDAGADPADMPYAGQRAVLGLPEIETTRFVADIPGNALASVSPDEFKSGFRRSFGRSNPERMNVPFWNSMILSGASAFEARQRFEEACGPCPEAVWSAQRYGQSLTLLPDGRAVQIGGEHEDYYDPDFCIYNDVFVHERDGTIAIYGYPESVFPPTDFHTATVVGDFIYVIGSLGYLGARRFGETPVYRLNVCTLRMDRLDTSGEAPGWIERHRADVVGPSEIRVSGGTVHTLRNGMESRDPTGGSFVLDVERLVWRMETGPAPHRSPH